MRETSRAAAFTAARFLFVGTVLFVPMLVLLLWFCVHTVVLVAQ
jgi:hypothetical protein